MDGQFWATAACSTRGDEPYRTAVERKGLTVSDFSQKRVQDCPISRVPVNLASRKAAAGPLRSALVQIAYLGKKGPVFLRNSTTQRLAQLQVPFPAADSLRQTAQKGLDA